MTTTRINITARDETLAAFSSVGRNLDRLSGGARAINGAFAALGVTVSTLSFTQMIRGTADAQDKLAKMSRATGIAVESLAGLEFAASQSGTSLERISKGVNNFSRIILEAEKGTGKYSKIIQAIGLDLDALKKATPEEQFIALAGAIKENVSEQERAAVITSLLGERYTELATLLSQGEDGIRGLIEEGRKLNPVTQESAEQAELFNDNLDKLNRTFRTVTVEIGNNAIPMINSFTTEVVEASKEAGILAGILVGLENIYKSDAFLSAVEFSGPLGVILAGRARAKIAQEEAAEVTKNTALEGSRQLWLGVADAMDQVSDGSKEAQGAVGSLSKELQGTDSGSKVTKLLEELNNKSKSGAGSIKSLTKELSDEEKQAQQTEKKIEQLTLQFDPLIARNKELAELIQLRNEGLSQNVFESAATASINRYQEAIKDTTGSLSEADEQTKKLQQTTQQVFDSNEQIIISGVRRIQGAVSDGLFNFFDDGLGGMVRSTKNAVGRIVAEFASIKLLQASGLSGLLGLGSTAAFASGGSGASGLSLAGAGLGAASLINSGFGASNLVNVFAGTGIGQRLGLSVTGPVPGFGQLTSLGSGLSTAASTAGAGAFGVLGGSLLAGDKKLGGLGGSATSSIGAGAGALVGSFFGVPQLGALGGGLIGGAINGLFGRGPLKFKEQTLLGDVTEAGFEGALVDRFKAKGGLLRGSKTDNIIIDTDTGELLNRFKGFSESGISSKLQPVADQRTEDALALGKLLDESFKTIGQTLRSTADILDINSSGLDGFNTELRLISEKGETLSQQQFSEEIARISDEMTRSLIPGIDQLSKHGETASQVVTRLGNEFKSIERGLIIFGDTAEAAKDKTLALSLAQRTDLVDQFGGVDVLDAKLTSFFDNVLTDSQKLDILEDTVRSALKTVGVDFVPTMDQFREAMLSGKLSVEQINTGLEFSGLIVEVNNLRQAVSQTGDEIADTVDTLQRSVVDLLDIQASAAQKAFGRLSQSVDAERNRLTDEYNDKLRDQDSIIQDIGQSINDLKALSNTLVSASQQLNPLSIGAARQQIENAIQSVRGGVIPASGSLSQALQTLTNQSTDGFRTRTDFLREQGKSSGLIGRLSGLINGQLGIQEDALKTAQDSRDELTDGFDKQISQLDSLLIEAQIQVDLLQGIDSTLLDMATALGKFNAVTGSSGRLSQVGAKIGSINDDDVVLGPQIAAGLGGSGGTVGPSPISDQAIKNFLNSNPTAEQLAAAAIRFDVGSDRIAKVGGFSQSQVDEFFRLHPDIPKFESGTSFVPRTGPAIVHQGERIINPEQNKDLIDLLKQVVTATLESADASNRTYEFLRELSSDGESLNMRPVT